MDFEFLQVGYGDKVGLYLMADYTDPDIEVAGYVITQVDWNILVNNFKAGDLAAFTTLGDVFIATGANAGKRAALMNSSDLVIQEVGGIEADISAIVAGGILRGTGTGTFGILGKGNALEVLRVNAGATDLEYAVVSSDVNKSAVSFANIRLFGH